MEYSGLATKLRAMHSRLMTDEEIRNLGELESISELISFLKSSDVYGKAFSGEDERNLGRVRIEQLLRSTVYTDYEKIYYFSDNKQREFLKLYFTKYEIMIIKLCLRLQYSNNDTVYDGTDVFARFFEKWMSINIDTLINSNSIDELVSSLVTTQYYKVLKVLQGKQDVTLFDYEVLLDTYYFKTVWKAAKKQLGRRDCGIILQSYGTEIDILNLQWIYRAKKYYGLSEAEIYAQLIPVFYKLQKRDISRLVNTSGDDQFIHVLTTLPYASRLGLKYPQDLERIYRILMNKIHRRAVKNNPYSIACIDSYFYCKEKEVEQLIKLTECIMYGKNSEEIMDNVIMG